MTRRSLAVFLLIFALSLSTASATTILVGAEDLRLPGGDRDYNDLMFRMSSLNLAIHGSGTWQQMVAPNEDGTPYWDNRSYDGPGGWNVGFNVTGTGNFVGNPYSPRWSVAETRYWGVGTNPDPNFLFFSTGGVESEILAEVSAYSANTNLSWFSVINPSSLHLILSGSDGPGRMVSFNPGGVDFGLMASSPGGDFRTDRNGEQFAMFTQTPEPGTLVLTGLGFALVGLSRLRRKKVN